ncbi:hypothetical protein [Ramlibacter humi]|uniref:Gluconate 2-dehydrogenase subunit 3 family protein n=1 Tax=Ramlibacter humi TaxID=2530451 RepID=A0A4Z0BJ33_9BURK|nr:hypothetical protein [Ramlibacter humi]TFY98267.1 hypothetical protein EZ216_16870 [Ramlibacter humi]
MKRRSWLKLGLAAGALLAAGGGALALLEPGWQSGRLTASGRRVFLNAGRAFLDGSLPAEPSAREAALASFLDRTDALIAALPAHAQRELSQLLALLASAPGRRALAGLVPDWQDANLGELQQALQSMRTSPRELKQQAYGALHDICGGAYFSDVGTWARLGYPGPMEI